MADQEETLAAFLEPLIDESLDMFGSWEEIDSGVFADNLAIALIARGVLLPQEREKISESTEAPA